MKFTTTRGISLEGVIDFYGNQSEIGIGVVEYQLGQLFD